MLKYYQSIEFKYIKLSLQLVNINMLTIKKDIIKIERYYIHSLNYKHHTLLI